MSFFKKIKLPPKLKKILTAVFFTVRDLLILLAATYGYCAILDYIHLRGETYNIFLVTGGMLLPTIATLLIFTTDKRYKKHAKKIVAACIVFAVGSAIALGYKVLMTGMLDYGIDTQLVDSLFMYLLIRILFRPEKIENTVTADNESVQPAEPAANI